MAERRLNFVVSVEQIGRIDAAVSKATDLPRSRSRGLIEHGGVRINETLCMDPSQPLAVGDNVAITFDTERKYREKSSSRPTRGFDVVFSDEHVVVVNKWSGVLTVPTNRRETNTLVDLLSHHLAKGQVRHKKVSIIHRLDRDTSGLLIFAKSNEAANKLKLQFLAKKPEREYLAIVAGRVQEDQGTISSYLATDQDLNQYSVDSDGDDSDHGKSEVGKLAITHFRVSDRFKDATAIVVNLETGRRNQIRVHFAEKGHPILGDVRYEVAKATHRLWPYKRLALHARVLGFIHPNSGEKMRFEAGTPKEFNEFKDRHR